MGISPKRVLKELFYVGLEFLPLSLQKRYWLMIEAKSKNNDKRLSADEWGELYNIKSLESVVNRIVKGHVSEHSHEMLKLTKPGERILEIGVGSGQTSLWLAKHGRLVTGIDFSNNAIRLFSEAAEQLNIPVQAVQVDAEKPLPFEENEFDWVFQAGLLEHFHLEERIRLLQQWGKYTRGMISFIPNAASVIYRYGKARQEYLGTWKYGLEMPQYSLAGEFAAAGFSLEAEYTFDLKTPLDFLPRFHYLRRVFRRLQRDGFLADNCGQGYLLATVGKKKQQ